VRMRAVCDAVRREPLDLLCVWDWWRRLEAYYGVHLAMHVPIVVTAMMMELACVLPRTPLDAAGKARP